MPLSKPPLVTEMLFYSHKAIYIISSLTSLFFLCSLGFCNTTTLLLYILLLVLLLDSSTLEHVKGVRGGEGGGGGRGGKRSGQGYSWEGDVSG